MSRIIEIIEFGVPQSIIQREGKETGEMIYVCMLIDELNEQLKQSKLNMTRDCVCNLKVHKKDADSFPYGESVEYDECVGCGKIHNVIIH